MSNTHSFAHISDVHIGAFRNPLLQNLVVDAFVKALDTCIQRSVDFIIIGGDLFDSNLPEMSLVDKAVKKMDEVRRNGIEIFVIYGSHDFSPNQSSIVDILASASLFQKITKGVVDENNKLNLQFNIHKKTGAKLVGMSGLKAGTEKQYYEILDRQTLEKEDGFKIFVFHGMISEYKPKKIAAMDSMAISYLPTNFNYYAGGHLHEKVVGKMQGFENVVYPGALFGADMKDMENSARGQKRGFYIISFSAKVEDIEFIEISPCKYLLIEYDAHGKNPAKIQLDLNQNVEQVDAQKRLVMIKIIGEMAAGKTSELNFSALSKSFQEKGALYTLINHNQLTSKEYSSTKFTTFGTNDIEKKIFKESISNMKVSNAKLKGEFGVKLSIDLLKRIKQERKHNEVKGHYESRITNNCIDVIGLRKELEPT